VAFKPSDKRKFVAEDAELNLLPILNMIVVLIPLLLTSSEFVKLGLLETQLPPAAAGGGGGMAQELEAPLPKLSLIVSADPQGVAVSIFGATSASGAGNGQYRYLPNLPDGKMDFASVQTELLRVKREVVLPTVKGKIQAVDRANNPRFNRDGSPMMVDSYGFDDPETVIISAPNDLPFNQLVDLLDACRSKIDPETKKAEVLFPNPMMGKIQ
jgi:hypothetical protein